MKLRTALWLALPTLALAALGWCLPQESPGTLVSIRLVNGATGKTVPAMVCITDARDGTVRLPPDGRTSPAFSTTLEFTRGIPFRKDPGWIGPVRKTTGKGNNRDRSYVYEAMPSLPFWSDPAMYQTSGEFSIRLPEGKWRVAASRGMEYVPVSDEFATDGAGRLEKSLTLDRWIDLAKEGWMSGDIHVHHPTTEESHRDYLLEYARAEDVRLVNILEQIHHGGRHSPQAGFGEKFRVRRGDTWLVSGQEAPSSTFGHVIGLNVDRLVHDPETTDFYEVSFRRIHEIKGALVGYAHFSWNGCDLPRGFPWTVTTGELDFVELLQFMKINTLDYYDYLNLGFKLTAAAGSDVPWGSTMGEVRTYVQTGATLDAERWFEGLKRGNSFVTNGPALEFTVDGQLPGAVLERASGAAVEAVARVRCHPRIGALQSLRVVSNEGTIKAVAPAGEETELTLAIEVPLARSRWLAASAACANGAVAHSSPVYVTVDKRPTWCPQSAPRIIDKQIAAIRKVEKEFSGKSDPRSRGILERLGRAVKFYGDLKAAIARP